MCELLNIAFDAITERADDDMMRKNIFELAARKIKALKSNPYFTEIILRDHAELEQQLNARAKNKSSFLPGRVDNATRFKVERRCGD